MSPARALVVAAGYFNVSSAAKAGAPAGLYGGAELVLVGPLDAGALRRWLKTWLELMLWAAAAGLCARPCTAQVPVDAVVRGELRDEHWDRLAGATVRLVNRETGVAAYARTDSRGGFGFLGLPPGEYTGAVRLMWLPVWSGSLSMHVDAGDAADLTLRLRAGEEGMALEAAADPGGGLEARIAAVADRKQVQKGKGGGAAAGLNRLGTLPVEDRDWEEVAEVSAAARDTTLAGGGSAQDPDEGEDAASAREERETGSAASGLNFDGLGVPGTEERLDGLSADQSFRGGPRGSAAGGARAGSSFAQEAVGRLRAIPRTFSALVGGTGSGGLEVASRGVPAGSRLGVHGSAFFQARESAWAAVNPFSVISTYSAGGVGSALVRPADSFLQFGGAVGTSARLPGLGERWRVGLFGAVEARQREQILFSAPETADFFQLSNTQRALLANRGVRTAQIGAALSYLSGLTGPQALYGAQWLGFGRVDLAPARADRVSLAYQAQRSATPATGGGQVSEGVLDRALGTVGMRGIDVDAGTVRWLHVLGPRWTNELRGQLARDVEAETPGAGVSQVPAIGPGGFAPQVTIAPHGFSYGTPATLGRVAYPDERRVEVADASIWRFGRHLVTVGGDWSRVDDLVLGATNLEGSFLYDSDTVNGHAGGLVDWITDYTYNVHAYPNGACPSVNASTHYFCFRSYSQSFANAETEFVTHDVAGFAEDAMRLGPALRVTLGARWQYQLLPFPLVPNATLDATLAGLGTQTVGAYGSTASFPEDRNNVGPRAAVSWSPGAARRGTGAWFTVQAGYGMFFGRLPGATLNAALTETGVVQATTKIRITPTVETACPQVANQGFGYPCAFLYEPAGVAAVAQTGSVVLFARRFRLPAVQRASFAVEREFGRRLLVRGEYATAWATQLPQTTDLNIAPSTSTISYIVQGGTGRAGLWAGQNFQVPLYTVRRTTKFGPVTSIESNANATYHSGTAEATLRAWHGVGMRASYAFSKTVDYGPTVGASPRQDGQFDPFADGYDKGLSNLDRPWGAAVAMTGRSSWERGGEWMRRTLSGWELATVARAGSGAPYSYTIFGGTRLTGGHESINGSGGATYLPTVGRNTLRLPMRSKVDVRASKELELGSGRGRDWRLVLHADVFNALNTVSLSRVETRAFLLGTVASVGGMTPLVFQDAATVASEGITTPAFGTPLSSTTGLSRERTMEMGVRFSF